MLSIRKIGVVGRTYRHLSRYRQILAIFFKYGFGDLIELLKIEQYIEVGLQLISSKRRDRVEKLSRAQRVRMAIEELGPTYIKLGQVLSTRPDLVPAQFIKELAKLQDNVPPFGFSEVSRIIEAEFGVPLKKLFEYFDENSFASASIGQVHRARLADGETVAVKVQRPGIKKIIEVDLEIMLHLATLMERNIEEMSLFRPVKIVEEFARTLEKEIDYTIEATSMERFGRNFLADPSTYVPKVFRDTSSERVLTMEFMEGIKISDIDRIDKAGYDRELITVRGADFFLKQVFEHGFFHADPHPGNIFVLPDNVICLLDFGMTDSIDRQTREEFVDLIESVVHQHESRTAQVLLKLTSWDYKPDIRRLEKDVADFMGQHLYKPLKDIEIGKLLNRLLELVSRHRLIVPPDIFLMMKALTTIEGVALMLNPDFDMVRQTAPFIEQVKLARFYPGRIAGDVIKLGSDMLQFAHRFPKDMLEIMRLIRQQKLAVQMEHKGLETMLATYDQISNRISFSIIIAALIIGSALIVISAIPPLFYGISLIGIIGFLAAALMGIWLLVAILRKGRL
ncbi:MAG: AarF/ABC1/UbiB kinase family protein [Desulfobacterales bacterium]|uniref:AarF/ABC1/UbiB kinase family protein n=1 Tax=Candidatus Desulfatibia vada TaxID=2841696 RepID=A0A8J6P3N9_9BACT|nr:AarF/ABC1/UbiB kinase family protein [Candidatus Desulfatibia vada]